MSSDRTSSCHGAVIRFHGADAFMLVARSLGKMMEEICKELRSEIVLDTEMKDLALVKG